MNSQATQPCRNADIVTVRNAPATVAHWPVSAALPGRRRVERRWESLAVDPAVKDELLDHAAVRHLSRYDAAVERFIGTAKIPIGIAGPLRIEGGVARGEYAIPLATSEAALVASYHRGARVITAAGGCRSLVAAESLSRAPAFAFANLVEVRQFLDWLDGVRGCLAEVAATTTRYGRLIGVRPVVEGNHVYLDCEFTTGDAAGQNMVTLAAEAIVAFILSAAPVKPRYHILEANLSGDKKLCARSLAHVRGRRVTAEVVLPRALVRSRLRTSVEAMIDCWRLCAIGGALSGTGGFQGQFANGLAALFLACGQDVACVAESSAGITRMESVRGDLYAAVTLPALVVGTVGGGTSLPAPQACLRILGLRGDGSGNAFAEISAALALAGELSLTAALSAQEFARAHRRLARRRS